MPLLSVFDAVGFLATLVVTSSGTGTNSSFRGRKELVSPTSAARGLVSVQQTERELQSGSRGPCIRSLLDLVEKEKLSQWRDCFDLKVNASDMRVAGSSFQAQLQCWCDNKVEDVLSEYGCCQHPDYALMCQADCKPDCSTAKAQQCIKDCPAVCLESDYAPEFCNQGCSQCFEYMMCITKHSKEMTTAGHASNPLLCDDVGFDQSTQWEAWRKCYSEHPKRTHWHRHNAENYCYCKADLKGAAMAHNCCDAAWGKTICDEQCVTEESHILCDSVEAHSCMEACKQTCHKLSGEAMVPECKSTCFDNGSRCAKYSVCEPKGSFEFDYVCDDGTPPMTNGCCALDDQFVGCPTLCDSAAPHYPLHSARGYTSSHGLECQCLGCPVSTNSAKDKWRDTLTNDLWSHGVATLATISKEVGILGANRRMQELMKARNDAIMAAYEAHPGVPDDAFQAKVDIIVADYHAQIVVEAKRFKESGEEEAPTPTPTPTPNEDSGSQATVAVTSLSSPVAAGVKSLPVATQEGFSVGQKIVIAPSTAQEEVNEIAGFGSIILKDPLKFSHSAGVSISSLPPTTENEAGEKVGADKPLAVASTPVGTEDGDGDSTTIIIVVCGVAGLFLICIILVLVYMLMGRSQKKQPSTSNAGAISYDPDSNVVMGRPVEEGAAREAAQGAPARPKGPEEKNSDKMTN